jgi:intracellular septation protein A
VVYELLDAHYGDTKALIASAMPPLVWSVYELFKTRRLDAISVVVVASILFTVAATALGGSARLIQIREALVTGLVGVIFVFTAPPPPDDLLSRARNDGPQHHRRP